MTETNSIKQLRRPFSEFSSIVYKIHIEWWVSARQTNYA